MNHRRSSSANRIGNQADGTGVEEFFTPCPAKNSKEGLKIQKEKGVVRAYSKDRVIKTVLTPSEDKGIDPEEGPTSNTPSKTPKVFKDARASTPNKILDGQKNSLQKRLNAATPNKKSVAGINGRTPQKGTSPNKISTDKKRQQMTSKNVGPSAKRLHLTSDKRSSTPNKQPTTKLLHLTPEKRRSTPNKKPITKPLHMTPEKRRSTPNKQPATKSSKKISVPSKPSARNSGNSAQNLKESNGAALHRQLNQIIAFGNEIKPKQTDLEMKQVVLDFMTKLLHEKETDVSLSEGNKVFFSTKKFRKQM